MSVPVILIIEDQKSMADVIKENLQQETQYHILVAYSFEQAKKLIESGQQITVCITDLNLPDADEGATVPLLHKHNIATVVLTANYMEATRQKMYKERVADYVIKDGLSAIKYAVQTVINLVENSSHLIWVVSQPSKNSKRLIGLLNIHRYKVAMFENANEMVSMLHKKAPDLVILNEPSLMVDCDNVSFIQKVRSIYSQSQLPVLISEDNVDINQMIKLMKYGVNDFYNLKFTIEELYVRLQLNISLAKSYRQIEEISQTDSLTGLYNRRHFFKRADKVASFSDKRFAVMIDIDHFKSVNDTYGHDQGDIAIKITADQLKHHFDGFLVARFGGEEFCVFGVYEDFSEIKALCESFRVLIEERSKPETGVAFTVSIGLAMNSLDSIEKMISSADKALYQAKESGRNKVIVSANEHD